MSPAPNASALSKQSRPTQAATQSIWEYRAAPIGWTASPSTGSRHKTYDKLTALISSKQTLIKKALGVDELPVELTDKGFDFAWFSANATPAEQTAYRRKTYRLADYKSGALSPYATSL